ncbi:hypothetical protein [Spirilliplanes yamanashiensis]|uniref:Uncharacterized protein n=1 Tax=Spirilliplanes yamanashiensis TaxID=42233 RepID=A0A8J3Y677_9ACTN|nr:hypothetical protein [Spirilliplanes yamanashiensis]MDP9814601.1 hypothetical protein [Spirilliplanes yamanashiensis]GIJ02254.1 hypothetical protein Sya03_16060 [Spirilliplanes yamanashiensis]
MTETDPWAEYVAAAQRLDTVRRAASDAAKLRTEAAAAAQVELTGLQARLAPQRARLAQDVGVPETDLTPTTTDLELASQAVAGGPAAVAAALRDARGTADAADAATVRTGRIAAPWQRNLLVYGPFALVVLVVQVVLSAVADSQARLGYALLCSLTLPVFAFALGWLAIGVVWGGKDAKVDRTPIMGAAVCLAPVLISCMGVGLMSLVN